MIRGFHYQVKKPISQIVYVKKGKILDVVVDIRKNSKIMESMNPNLSYMKQTKRLMFMIKRFCPWFLCFR